MLIGRTRQRHVQGGRSIFALVFALGILAAIGAANAAATPTRTPTRTATRTPKRTPTPVPGKIYVTNGCPDAVAVYPATGNGDIAPAVALGLSPLKVARDSSGKIYVADQCGEILVYPAGSTGNVPPMARIAGGTTQLGAANAIAVHAGANIY